MSVDPAAQRLWHVSEDAGIAHFESRVPPAASGIAQPVVWAVADTHLVSYLLPRECPRVAIRRSAETTPADLERFMGSATPSQTVLFIESAWLVRAEHTPLWLYALPSETFEPADANAGYFVSRHAVSPLSVQKVESPLTELAARGTELRVVDRLRLIAEDIAASSLAFSVIRLRNAA